MKDKIVHLMKSEGLTLSRLAEILEVQPSGVSHIVSGRNNPRFDLLQKILKRFPQINPDWLLLDAPNMYREELLHTTSANATQGEFSPVDLFGIGVNPAPKSGSSNSSKSERDELQFLDGDSPQKRESNAARNMGHTTPSSPSVERIIILYSDNTFRTYEMR